LEEAEKVLSNAQSLNAKAEYLWRYYAVLHKKRKDLAKQIEAWENLQTLGGARSESGHSWFLLSNLHFRLPTGTANRPESIRGARRHVSPSLLGTPTD
jgi:hypothetical protein